MIDCTQYAGFIEEQDKVYDKFKNSREKVLAEGLNRQQLSSKGMYLIYFMHPTDISEKVEELSKDISKIVPTMMYTAPNIHTTISDYMGPALDFNCNEEILKRLSLGLRNASRLSSPVITYQNMLNNQDTIVLKGMPTISFLEAVYSVIDGMDKEGIALRKPWGAHITVARINDRVEDKDKVGMLLDYVDSHKFDLSSVPTGIAVGYGVFSPEGLDFKLTKFDEYRFR